jgi:predicted transposase YdaD
MDMEKIYIDIRKTPLYKFVFKKGVEKGIEKGKIEGKIEGRIEGLKEAILLDVQIRFGKNKVALVKKKIEDIDSMEKLRVIKSEVLKAHSWQDFLRSIQKSIQSSNGKPAKSNSKMKARKKSKIGLIG